MKTIRRADRAARGETVAAAQPLYGATPIPNDPLDVVQIDHTKVDLIVVDPQDREPIGRPWITLAIDVYSRCIAGFYLSLDPPSATSVGLCLTHIATDKDAWMAARNVTEVAWPVSGKPQCIGVDNAAEFHSAAFERGCAQHGIDIDWRPLGAPHFGGIVERVIGTFMQRVHQLPGTTFSSPQHRGTYDSENTARLTLDEFEHWLTVAIAKHYHRKAHRGLDGASPLDRYRQGLRDLAATGRAIARPRDLHAYLIDFLPVVRRTLQRDGFTIDHIRYFSNALKPWIEARDPRLNGPWTIRRDPRDLSRIYVLDPTDGSTLEVPYRTLTRPAITLWEQRAARKRLRDRYAARIDEDALFRALEEMRHIEHEARRLTWAERRQRARRQASGQARNEKPIAETEADKPNAADSAEPPGSPPVPFSEIEDW